MLANHWINDNEVRQYAHNFTAPPGTSIQDTAYRLYYQLASDVHHPTAQACLPLVLTDPTQPCNPRLQSTYDDDTFCMVLA